MKILVITTGVEAVYRDYGSERGAPLSRVSMSELSRMESEGQFPAGSMGPKIEAALHFLANGGEQVVICHPDALVEAFDGRAGTRIHRSTS